MGEKNEEEEGEGGRGGEGGGSVAANHSLESSDLSRGDIYYAV